MASPPNARSSDVYHGGVASRGAAVKGEATGDRREVWVRLDAENGAPVAVGRTENEARCTDGVSCQYCRVVPFVPATPPAQDAGQWIRPCEVCITTTDGNAIEQRDCGKPARLDVNGFPMCAACFAGFEAEGLIETVSPLSPPPPPESGR